MPMSNSICCVPTGSSQCFKHVPAAGSASGPWWHHAIGWVWVRFSYALLEPNRGNAIRNVTTDVQWYLMLTLFGGTFPLLETVIHFWAQKWAPEYLFLLSVWEEGLRFRIGAFTFFLELTLWIVARRAKRERVRGTLLLQTRDYRALRTLTVHAVWPN